MIFRGRANVTSMKTPLTATAKANATIEKIAREVLDLETLETRKMDSLDFHDLAVWEIRKALEAAYEAGRQAATKPTKALKLTGRMQIPSTTIEE